MLSIAALRAGYGAADVLKGVSCDIPQGSIVCLIGSNGAGKTTLLNTISGLLKPSAGTIRFLDAPLESGFPERILRRGIVQVPEGRKVFRNLTVYECLLMGGYSRRDKAEVKRDISAMYERFPRLAERRAQLAGTLSGGEQQMLAFARALVARPKLLLLDEPSMGLAPQVVDSVADLVVAIRDQGVTVLLVEQNAELALSIADRGYLLENGEITLSGDAKAMRESEKIRRAYLGL